MESLTDIVDHTIIHDTSENYLILPGKFISLPVDESRIKTRLCQPGQIQEWKTADGMVITIRSQAREIK
jgi:hypothetical protein